jgi:hypothetical protein
MATIAKRYQDSLDRIKLNIENSYNYFKPNYDRWHEFHKFIFITSLSEKDIEFLKILGKPPLEFNILEAYISRLRGEFYKQEPSIEVMPDFDTQIDPQVLDLVEGHIRHILTSANNDNTEYNVYTDMLAGGFSVMEVATEYAHEMSMKQIIKFGRVFDPTLCGFDPLARLSHKGDGRFCFKMYPKTKKEFEQEWPDIDIKEVKFTKSIEGFNWSYNTNKEEILLVVDYYEKKKKQVKIVELPNGQVLTDDKYKEMLDTWSDFTQPPEIGAGHSRKTTIETICRYRLIENQVIEYVETDFKMLPLVFADGNSVFMRDKGDGDLQQHTRPYPYHAKGTQKLKNYAGQTLANELENMVQHKWIAAEEAIPEKQEFVKGYTNPQLPTTLIYKAFMDNDPTKPIPPPQAVVRSPAPPEITATLQMTDQITQSILGSYDASLGINDNQLSGVAIVEAATQSNAAAMPYVVGFMQALNQIAQIIIDLIPKYYVTPRTIPVVTPDGKKSYQLINQQGAINLNYAENALNVRVEAGVSFSVQKSRALQQMIALMQASPLFAQFVNTVGLEELLDNLEIKGIDQLKQKVGMFLQQMQQQQQQMQQMQQQAMQNNPQMMRAQMEKAKIMMNAQQNQVDNQLKASDLALQEQKLENERLKMLAEIQNGERESLVQMDKHQTEKARMAVDMAMDVTDMHHRHDHERRGRDHEHMEVQRKIADTILTHRKREENEIPKEELEENE